MSGENLPKGWFIDGSNFSQYKDTPHTEKVRRILLRTSSDAVAVILYPEIIKRTGPLHGYALYGSVREFIRLISNIIDTGDIWDINLYVTLRNLHKSTEIQSLKQRINTDDSTGTQPEITNPINPTTLREQLVPIGDFIKQKLGKISFF